MHWDMCAVGFRRPLFPLVEQVRGETSTLVSGMSDLYPSPPAEGASFFSLV